MGLKQKKGEQNMGAPPARTGAPPCDSVGWEEGHGGASLHGSPGVS